MKLLSSDVIIILFNIAASQLAVGLKQCALNYSVLHQTKMEAKRDLTVEPCDDFYTYACGNWDVTYRLRKLGARDTLTTIKAENKLLLMEYFESGTQVETVSPQRQKLLNFYRSCTNLQTKEEKNASLQTYADTLRGFSDWPILNPYFMESTANISFNWEYVSAELARYGAHTFWQSLVQPNWQAGEQLIFYIVSPIFDFLQRSQSVSRSDNSQDEDDAFLYKTYLKYLLLDMGVRVRKALRYASEIVEFEQQLMALVLPDHNSVVLKEPQTLASLALELPSIQVLKYFEVLLQDVRLPKNYAEHILVAADTVYLTKLSQLIERTKPKLIGMYLLVKFLAHFEVGLHDEQEVTARQEHCLQQANIFLPDELLSLFLDLKHDGNGAEFLRKADFQFNEIFTNLKLQFESMMNSTNVFDHNLQTRAESLEKLRTMHLRLPNFDIEENAAILPDDVNMGENYDLNLLILSKRRRLHELQGIKTFVPHNNTALDTVSQFQLDKYASSFTTTSYGPLDVNAYYRLKKNTIEIPVGLLNSPIYDRCLNASMLYGSIAYIMGHELIHGFDYDGLNYDKSGNIADGWDPKSIIAFGTKASCYLGSRYDDAHINVNENIADSEGLRLALSSLQRHAAALTLENLKIFFMSFGQTWCRISSEYPQRHTLHAIHRERVNNVLGNFPEFAEAFNCKAGSTMNPNEKCRIW